MSYAFAPVADGSHKCCKNKCYLCSGHVLNRRHEGRPVFNVMSWSENMEAYVAAMTQLKKLEPASWAQLEILLSDLQKSPKNAYAAVEGHEIAQWVACFW